ncbi:unnamed protein product [Scytosiphon promiscuus]
MSQSPSETCDSVPSSLSAMAYSCDLQRLFTYEGSETDIWINYVTLLLTLVTLVLCTRRAGEVASRFSRFAAWFWVPFTLVLFAMQIFADCSTNNVGISAVWSAFVGFIFLGWCRIGHLRPGGTDTAVTRVPLSTSCAIPVSLAVWVGVCLYYAVVEEAMTSVAHLVSFGVGAGGLLLFETLHAIPRQSPYDEQTNAEGVSRSHRGISSNAANPVPYEQLK